MAIALIHPCSGLCVLLHFLVLVCVCVTTFTSKPIFLFSYLAPATVTFFVFHNIQSCPSNSLVFIMLCFGSPRDCEVMLDQPCLAPASPASLFSFIRSASCCLCSLCLEHSASSMFSAHFSLLIAKPFHLSHPLISLK